MKATKRSLLVGQLQATQTAALGRGLMCACLLAAIAVSVPAHAQSNAADSDRANLLFKKGKLAFNDGKYNDALRIYAEAWSLKHSPDIAANLAQTESELGKHRDAAEHFAFALAHLLPSTTDEQKKALADGLDVEKKEVGTLHITLEPADAVLSVDDAPVTLPVTGDLFVEPGQHRCSVTREGYESNQQSVSVSKGASQVLWIKLVSAGTGAGLAPPTVPGAPGVPDNGPPNLSEGSARSLVPAVIGGGLVVAGAAVGVAFLLSANSSQSDANTIKNSLMGSNACGTGTPNTTQCNALHSKNSSVDSAHTVEAVGFAVAGAAAVGTVLYLLWPHSSPTTGRGLSPTFALAPGAGGLGLTGRF
ncbi:MAG TPA: tetratricopeptide repeat protein [Polyangiaceae bacterium]|jgi:hypothetical protein|nr:tetratricopeptide repeat protein [Polyangiaceae bacterium]